MSMTNEVAWHSKVLKETKANDDSATLGKVNTVLGSVTDLVPTTAKNLPEEVWLTIFEKLDTKDMVAFYQTGPKWQKWLSCKRTMFLFPQLATLVFDQLRSTSDILNLRLVCGSWKEAVDNYIEKHSSIVRLNEFEYEAENDFHPEFEVSLNHFEDILTLLRDMETHTGNPFPGRNIEFRPVYSLANNTEEEEENMIDCRAYWNNISQLLETFGSHLSIAQFVLKKVDLDSFEINQMEQRFRFFLMNLPNVKRLDFAIILMPDVNEDQMNLFEEQPLPQLPALESLTIQVPVPEIITEILESCCVPANIKRLQLHHERIARVPEVLYQFVNLEVLLISIHFASDLQRFKNLIQPPPLREVHFDIEGNVEFELIFTSLEKFKNTLVHANLSLYEFPTLQSKFKQNMTIMNGFKCKLPKLKKLTLFGYNGPLDPFLQLQSMVDLEIYDSGELWKWEGSVVNYLGFEAKMYQSNIWDLIPTLKSFTYAASSNEDGEPESPILYDRTKRYRSETAGGNDDTAGT